MPLIRLRIPRHPTLTMSPVVWIEDEPIGFLGPRVCNHFELHYLAKGEVGYESEGRRGVLKPGMLLICWPRQRFQMGRTDDRRPATYLHCHFMIEKITMQILPEDADELKAALSTDVIKTSGTRSFYLPHVLEIERRDLLTEQFARIIALQRNVAPGDDIAAEANLYLLLHAVSGEAISRVRQQVARSMQGLAGVKVQRGLQHIDRSIDRPLSLREVAGQVRANPQYFARIFKTATGVSVGGYIRRKRMNLAKERLLANGGTVAGVAHSLGFRDPLYFSRQFKQEVGLSPRDYMVLRRS